MTGGLTPERLLAQIEAIRALDARIEGITAAGRHRGGHPGRRPPGPARRHPRPPRLRHRQHPLRLQPAARAQIMERIAGAMRNPYVRSIAHPSGRLIGRREGYEIDIETLARVAAETGTFLEINGSPDRLDLTAPAARRAASLGATDGHLQRRAPSAGVRQPRGRGERGPPGMAERRRCGQHAAVGGPAAPVGGTLRAPGTAFAATTARNLSIPAANNHGGFGRWGYLEITDPWDAGKVIRAYLATFGSPVRPAPGWGTPL